jgi:putative phosphoribosyl transferase
MRFSNRSDAGRQLAARLLRYANRSDVIVLGLPRGGVPVAHEVAERLKAPLDVLLVRKLGAPGRPELTMGAIAARGVEVLSTSVIEHLRIPRALVRQAVAREQLELERRDKAFRGGRRPPIVHGRVVILVDDGLATGSTMEAALLSLRHQSPKTVVVAVPVGTRETCKRLRCLADRVVCLTMPDSLQAIGQWYEDFSQTTDDEVVRLLEHQTTTSNAPPPHRRRRSRPARRSQAWHARGLPRARVHHA